MNFFVFYGYSRDASDSLLLLLLQGGDGVLLSIKFPQASLALASISKGLICDATLGLLLLIFVLLSSFGKCSEQHMMFLGSIFS